jgi:hypothetical protein
MGALSTRRRFGSCRTIYFTHVELVNGNAPVESRIRANAQNFGGFFH